MTTLDEQREMVDEFVREQEAREAGLSEGRRIHARAMPLDQFPAWKQAEIAEAVAQEKPPPRWLKLGDPDRGVVWAEIPSRAWFEWHWARGRYPGGNDSRPRLPAGTREAVIERDGYVCGLCGGEVEPDDVHIDHIHPWSLGGSDNLENLQVAHSLCNIRKGNRA